MEYDRYTGASASSTIELSRRFYQEKGAPMIREKFPSYEGRIAVGVAGEGSDCFGFDDAISQDHDFGIGFCMWLTDEDYQTIGPALQAAYRDLIGEAAASRLDFRRGVTTIREFYKRMLDAEIDPARPGLSAAQWFQISEHKLAQAVNGAVFRDDLGAFSRIRQELMYYYPDRVWRMRVINALHDFSQYGQANYGRCMGRRDYVSAEFCRAKGIEAAIDLAFLLARAYAPYYKWKFRALKELAGFGDLVRVLEQLAITPSQQAAWTNYTYDPRGTNPADQIESGFETAARILADKLRQCGLVQDAQTFLEANISYMAANIDRPVTPLR